MSEQELPQSILTAEQDHGEGWEAAIVEIFGHRSHAGFIREEERFGAKMIRIDVPKNGDVDHPVWETHWYGGASIFSLTLTDAASVFAANLPYRSDYGSEDESPDDFNFFAYTDRCCEPIRSQSPLSLALSRFARGSALWLGGRIAGRFRWQRRLRELTLSRPTSTSPES